MTPDTIQVLGAAATLYGLGGALSVLLQARRMHVRGTSGDVSARFFAVYVGGFAVWLLYGLGIGDVPIIVVRHAGGYAQAPPTRRPGCGGSAGRRRSSAETTRPTSPTRTGI
jgi:uncharacterized protein with PQ loop repeat